MDPGERCPSQVVLGSAGQCRGQGSAAGWERDRAGDGQGWGRAGCPGEVPGQRGRPAAHPQGCPDRGRARCRGRGEGAARAQPSPPAARCPPLPYPAAARQEGSLPGLARGLCWHPALGNPEVSPASRASDDQLLGDGKGCVCMCLPSHNLPREEKP